MKDAGVVITDLSAGAGENVAKDPDCVFTTADVTRRAGCEAPLKTTLDIYGEVDIVVNNAGTTYANKPTKEVTDAEFDLCFNVNTKSISLSTSVLLPYLLGNNRPGAFVQGASTAGVRSRPRLTWYAQKRQ